MHLHSRATERSFGAQKHMLLKVFVLMAQQASLGLRSWACNQVIGSIDAPTYMNYRAKFCHCEICVKPKVSFIIEQIDVHMQFVSLDRL